MSVYFTLFIGSSWVAHIWLMPINFIPLHRGSVPHLPQPPGNHGSATADIF